MVSPPGGMGARRTAAATGLPGARAHSAAAGGEQAACGACLWARARCTTWQPLSARTRVVTPVPPLQHNPLLAAGERLVGCSAAWSRGVRARWQWAHCGGRLSARERRLRRAVRTVGEAAAERCQEADEERAAHQYASQVGLHAGRGWRHAGRMQAPAGESGAAGQRVPATGWWPPTPIATAALGARPPPCRVHPAVRPAQALAAAGQRAGGRPGAANSCAVRGWQSLEPREAVSHAQQQQKQIGEEDVRPLPGRGLNTCCAPSAG